MSNSSSWRLYRALYLQDETCIAFATQSSAHSSSSSSSSSKAAQTKEQVMLVLSPSGACCKIHSGGESHQYLTDCVPSALAGIVSEALRFRNLLASAPFLSARFQFQEGEKSLTRTSRRSLCKVEYELEGGSVSPSLFERYYRVQALRHVPHGQAASLLARGPLRGSYWRCLPASHRERGAEQLERRGVKGQEGQDWGALERVSLAPLWALRGGGEASPSLSYPPFHSPLLAELSEDTIYYRGEGEEAEAWPSPLSRPSSLSSSSLSSSSLSSSSLSEVVLRGERFSFHRNAEGEEEEGVEAHVSLLHYILDNELICYGERDPPLFGLLHRERRVCAHLLHFLLHTSPAPSLLSTPSPCPPSSSLFSISSLSLPYREESAELTLYAEREGGERLALHCSLLRGFLSSHQEEAGGAEQWEVKLLRLRCLDLSLSFQPPFHCIEGAVYSLPLQQLSFSPEDFLEQRGLFSPLLSPPHPLLSLCTQRLLALCRTLSEMGRTGEGGLAALWERQSRLLLQAKAAEHMSGLRLRCQALRVRTHNIKDDALDKQEGVEEEKEGLGQRILKAMSRSEEVVQRNRELLEQQSALGY